MRIPRRYSHFVFGAVQSGLTCLIAAGITSMPVTALGPFLHHWMLAWLISWATMLPVVLFAAPGIRALSMALTREDTAQTVASKQGHSAAIGNRS